MTDLVAAVRDGRVLVRPTATGPALAEHAAGEGSSRLRDLARSLGVGAVTPLAPARRLDLDPPLTVHLVEPDGEPDGAAWLGLTDLDRLQHPAAVASAVRTGLAEHSGAVPWPSRRAAWYRAGWRPSVDAWVDGALARAGMRRAGASRVVKCWSLSAVLEVPVTDPAVGAVFFKAAGGPFVAEAAITALLRRLAPGSLPTLLDLDARRGWMLMLPFPQPVEDPAAAPAAARALAHIQNAVSSHLDELLAAGAADRRAGPTLEALTDVAQRGVERHLLTAEEQRDLVELLPWFGAQLDALDASGPPTSVGHGDLHSGNYTVDQGRVVIFDWTDAALTSPVIDVVLLARSAGPDHEQATLDAYVAAWRDLRPDLDVRAALAPARVVHHGYQAVSFDGIYRSQEQQSRGELAGLSARNLRQLVQAWRDQR